jgi:cyclophilin family peptidyl-prolyl cis-trans isomerase
MKLDPHALPSTGDIQKTIFQTLQARKTPILIGVGVVGAAIVLYFFWSAAKKSQREEIYTAIHVADQDLMQNAAQGVVSHDEVVRKAAGTDLEDYALWRLALACYQAATGGDAPETELIGYLDQGIDALSRLESEFPESRWSLASDAEDPNQTRLRVLQRKMKADRKWLADHVYKHPEADTTTTALIETRFGKIKLGFFPELAPNHVANFVKLAKEGFYNGLLIHRIARGFVIQMGDPNTRDRDAMETHGTGGPGYTMVHERSRLLVRHLRGVVSTAKGSGASEGSGSQFFICLADNRPLDKQYTPFAEVVEGMDIVDAIAEAPTYGVERPGLSEHPTADIVIRSISIWKDGKIDEGHDWDTSIVGSDWKDPEPAPRDDDDADGPDAALKARLEALMATVNDLEKEGRVPEAIQKLKEILELDASYEPALKKMEALAPETDD